MTEQPPEIPQNVLVIDCPEAIAIAQSLDPPPMILSITFRQLSKPLLALSAPDCIALPLFCAGFDAVQAIELLTALGYSGRICAFAPDLPQPDLVAAELTALAGGHPVSVITPGSSRHQRSR